MACWLDCKIIEPEESLDRGSLSAGAYSSFGVAYNSGETSPPGSPSSRGSVSASAAEFVQPSWAVKSKARCRDCSYWPSLGVS